MTDNRHGSAAFLLVQHRAAREIERDSVGFLAYGEIERKNSPAGFHIILFCNAIFEAWRLTPISYTDRPQRYSRSVSLSFMSFHGSAEAWSLRVLRYRTSRAPTTTITYFRMPGRCVVRRALIESHR